jgi:hypothetical protein
MRPLNPLTGLLLLLLAGPTIAQQTDCNPVVIAHSGENLIAAPQGATAATRVKIVRNVNGRPETVDNLEFDVTNGVWTLDANGFQRIQAARNTHRLQIVTAWFQGDSLRVSRQFQLPGENTQQVCAEPIAGLTGSPQGPSTTSTPADFLTLDACRPHLDQMQTKINQRLGSDHFVIIIFKPNGEECIKSKPRGTSGDLIYTAVLDNGTSQIPGPSIEFTKCEAPALSPNNPEGETLLKSLQAGENRLIEFPSRQCFGTSAEMTVKNKVQDPNPREVSKPFILPLFDKFRFSLQAGLLGSSQHSPTFGLRKDGTDMKIFSKGPSGSGPEYVASVILYGLPHYFGVGNPPRGNGDGEKDALASYFGRDPFHENRFADRLGLVLGAGLNNPGDRVVAGLSFELGYGINAIGVYEYAKLKELAGVSEGAVFTGTVEQIPTREAWKGRWVGGLSIDTRYFTRLVKRATS